MKGATWLSSSVSSFLHKLGVSLLQCHDARAEGSTVRSCHFYSSGLKNTTYFLGKRPGGREGRPNFRRGNLPDSPFSREQSPLQLQAAHIGYKGQAH